MEITIDGNPIPQKQTAFRRIGTKVHTYDPCAREKKTIQNLLRSQWKFKTLEDPLYVALYFYLPIPQSTSNKTKLFMQEKKIYHTKKPDIDNLAYFYVNAMKTIVYQDDNQICCMFMNKMYDERPRTEIIIFPL